jgi:hypothetical protein
VAVNRHEAVVPPTPERADEKTAEPAPPAADSAKPVAALARFPRRLFAISVHNYVFQPPVSDQGGIDATVTQLGELLRVPNDQIVLLSDKAAQPKPPTKEIIELNVKEFLESCVDQDRIVLLFVGHGVEVGGKPYLVPLDGGPPDNILGFIPLEWLYQQLEKCPARQKVLIVDVCRYDPSRGEERGAVAKMGPKFDALLQKPPAGVQVLTACVTEEYSYEIEAKPARSGGVMLGQVVEIGQGGGLKGVVQRPEDSIPMRIFSQVLGARTGAMARGLLRTHQTVRLMGSEAESQLAYDVKYRPAPKFEIKLAGAFEKGIATKQGVDAVFSDVAAIPALRPSQDAKPFDAAHLPPFPKDSVARYKDDGQDSELRKKVREAIGELKNAGQAQFQETFLRNFDPNNQQQANQFKNQLGQVQQNYGIVMFKLDSILDELDRMEADRAKENPRWQADYDYVRARLAAKYAHLMEYNSQLGQLRREFPMIDPMIHKGWQLVAREQIMDREAEKYAKIAKMHLDQLTKDNRGTPWEFVARREKLSPMGLEWRPWPK